MLSSKDKFGSIFFVAEKKWYMKTSKSTLFAEEKNIQWQISDVFVFVNDKMKGEQYLFPTVASRSFYSFFSSNNIYVHVIPNH